MAWALVLLGMQWPWLAMALKFAPLQHLQWAVALAAGGLSLLAMVSLHWGLAPHETRPS